MRNIPFGHVNYNEARDRNENPRVKDVDVSVAKKSRKLMSQSTAKHKDKNTIDDAQPRVNKSWNEVSFDPKSIF